MLTKKANRAIPLKAQLFDRNDNLVTPATLEMAPPPVVNVSYSSGTNEAADDSALLDPLGQSSLGNQFNFDSTTGNWWFNLATTPFTASGTYIITLQSGDTSKYEVVNSCSTACQNTYDDAVASCKINFNPVDCGGDVSCEQFVSNEQVNCTSIATATLNSCAAACPTTATQCSGRFVRP
jgi:hypothetical protein